jgi:DNA-binding GntR family transcriptional regulator
MNAAAARLRSRPAKKPAAGRPIYQRERDEIAGRIDRGRYVPNQQLPSERDLSESLGISRMTARQVYVTLQQDGLIYRSNRRGWFVSPPRLNYADAFRQLPHQRQAEGGTPAKVLEARTLRLQPGSRKARSQPHRAHHSVRRLLFIGDQPR